MCFLLLFQIRGDNRKFQAALIFQENFVASANAVSALSQARLIPMRFLRHCSQLDISDSSNIVFDTASALSETPVIRHQRFLGHC
jgi:hypothetical protein